MHNAVFEVRVPAELLDYGFDQESVQRQVLEWLVLSLFRDGHISSGKAARHLSLTRIGFLALLRRRGIAYVDYTPTEIAEELAAVDALPARDAS